MLCQNCHQREATCHVTTIFDEKMTKKDLCAECCEAASSPDAIELTELMSIFGNMRCEYCGAEAVSAELDTIATAASLDSLKRMCRECSTEYARYTAAEMQKLSEDASKLSHTENSALFRKLSEETDQHMKQWVKKRKLGPDR